MVLGLSGKQLAEIMGVDVRTVRRWEEIGGRQPSPTAVRVVQWMLDGFRPPEWPDELRAGKFGNPNFGFPKKNQ